MAFEDDILNLNLNEFTGTSPESIPLIDEPTLDPSTPLIDFQPRISSETRDNTLALQGTILRATNNLEDPIIAYRDVKSTPDKQEVINTGVQNKLTLELDTIMNFARERFEADQEPESVAQTTADTKAMADEVKEAANGPLANERAVANAAGIGSGLPFDIQEQLEEKLAIDLRLTNLLQEHTENEGTLDTLADFAGLLVPFAFNADVEDLTKEQGVANLATFVQKFKQMSPADQERIFPALINSVIESTATETAGGTKITKENKLRAREILSFLLSPEGAKKAQFTENFEKVLGTIDLVTLIPIMRGLKAATALKTAQTNAADITAKAGNIKASANVNAQVISNPGNATAKAANMTKEQAVNNSLPFDQRLTHPEKTAGLAPDTVEQLNRANAKADGLVMDIEQERLFLKEGVLTETEKGVRRKEIFDEVLQEIDHDYLNEGIKVQDVRVVKADESGETWRYTIINERGEQDIITKDFRFTIDDITGDFTQGIDEATMAGKFLGSPTWWARGPKEGFRRSVDAALRLDETTPLVERALANMIDESYKPIRRNRKSLEKVNAILEHGDEFVNPDSYVRGKVFTPEELARGVQTPDGVVKLNSKEIEAYQRYRHTADTYWELMNHSVGRQLDIQGFSKAAKLRGKDALVKEFDQGDAARVVKQNDIRKVYDEELGRAIDVDEDLIEKVYRDGKSLVRGLGDDAVGQAGDEVFDYYIVKPGSLKNRPSVVIHKKPGYVPKINDGVEYLVKERVPVIRNGKQGETLRVQRFFGSKKEADEFAGILNKENETTRFIVIRDRDQGVLQQLQSPAGPSGGLVTGHRSSQDLTIGLANVKPDRVAPFEALQRNTSVLARHITKNEWRLGEHQRYINTFRKMFPNETVESFDDALGKARSIAASTGDESHATLVRMGEEINRWTGVHTQSEGVFKNTVQAIHDASLVGLRKYTPGFKDKAAIKSILSLKHADVPSAARSATFHSLLGVFNPIQTWIQAQAAVVAMSRFGPQVGLKSVPHAVLAAYADNIKNPKALKEFLTKMDGKFKGFKDFYNIYERSGLRDGVFTNADISVMEKGIVSFGSFKRGLESGLIPYRAGELMNRRLSLAVEFVRRQGTKITPDIEKEMLTSSKVSMLNLSRANAAMWQGGPDRGPLNFLGVMTQFQQVQAKVAELMFKRVGAGGIPPAEKMRIAVGQMLLYGAAGFGGGSAAGSFIAKETLEAMGIDPETINPETAKLINGGIIEYAALQAFGMDNNISKRSQVIGEMSQFFIDLVTDSDPVYTRLLGASGTIGSRLGSALENIQVLSLAKDQDDSLDFSLFVDGLRSLAEIPSSTRNVLKAYIMAKHGVLITKNQNLWTKDQQFTAGTVIGQALGFEPSILSNARDIIQANEVDRKVMQGMKEWVMRAYNDYLYTSDQGSEARAKLDAKIKGIVQLLPNDTARRRLMDSVFRSLTEPKTKIEKEISKYFKTTLPSDVHDNYLIKIQQLHFPVTPGESAVQQPEELLNKIDRRQ